MSIILNNGSILSNKDLFAIPVDGNGWRLLPDGTKASIGESASIGEFASIGKFARIGESARIGKFASIGESASIGEFASIGKFARIGESARIGKFASIGESASIGEFASIGESASIGEFASIERTPLAVQGTKHLVYQHSRGKIGVGCQVHTIAAWLKNFAEIGKEFGYSEEEIEEYGRILRFVAENGITIGTVKKAVAA